MELLITTLFSGTFSEMNNKIASSNWYIDPIVVQSDIVLKESLETIINVLAEDSFLHQVQEPYILYTIYGFYVLSVLGNHLKKYSFILYF